MLRIAVATAFTLLMVVGSAAVAAEDEVAISQRVAAERAEKLVERARKVVADASDVGRPWSGPTRGPVAPAGRRIAFVAYDMRNGGIHGVAEGILQAAKAVDWTVDVLDAGGSDEGMMAAVARALESAPDALVLGGADAVDVTAAMSAGPMADRFKATPLFAWHGAPMPGRIPDTPTVVNVTSNSLAVAELAATAAVADSMGTAGVVILTDETFAIAREKAEAMRQVIARCGGCRVLEVRHVPIATAMTQMPAEAKALRARYGAAWTHTLAINDIYFDAMAPVTLPGGPTRNISAGDGSASAMERLLAAGNQLATVPEPLLMQGWQLIDEINRHLGGMAPSGFVPPVAVLTNTNAGQALTPGNLFDPPIAYRDAYRRIWTGQGTPQN